jgi:mitogen-activated protein kinase kinase kinase
MVCHLSNSLIMMKTINNFFFFYNRAIMFHIGVATQHPPLPEPGQLSELGINFIKQCLTIDPMTRPTAIELMDHAWIQELREDLLRYGEDAEIVVPPSGEIPAGETSEASSVPPLTT